MDAFSLVEDMFTKKAVDYFGMTEFVVACVEDLDYSWSSLFRSRAPKEPTTTWRIVLPSFSNSLRAISLVCATLRSECVCLRMCASVSSRRVVFMRLFRGTRLGPSLIFLNLDCFAIGLNRYAADLLEVGF